MSETMHCRSMAVMGTIVTIDVAVGHDQALEPVEREFSRPDAIHGDPAKGSVILRSAATKNLSACTAHTVGEKALAEIAVERAFEWFRSIEACCSRFDPQSELMQLSARIGVAVPVSAILYEAVQFALAVAEASGGAFDPTVGEAMEARGFNRDYRSGQQIYTALSSDATNHLTYRPTYKDVRLDPSARTITLLQPLVLDLGAVAKGLAIDMAARELQPFRDFAIDAGGDLYLGGSNPSGAPWSVGIRHPRANDHLIDFVRVSDRAVCTSGDYERRAPNEIGGHHILDPRTALRTARSANAAVSVTVIAPSAMLADALATAAFVLGPAEGVALLERMDVEGLVVCVEGVTVSEPPDRSSEPEGSPEPQGSPKEVALQTYATRGLELQAHANGHGALEVHAVPHATQGASQ